VFLSIHAGFNDFKNVSYLDGHFPRRVIILLEIDHEISFPKIVVELL
jgi:hypothetical protein